MESKRVLHPGGVHLWQARFSELMPHQTALAATLSPNEHARARRYLDEGVRSRFIIGRGLLRVLLSRYLNTSPNHITFVYGHRGKPALPDSLVTFNVAHADDVLLIGLTLERALGVDVERVRPMREMATVARDNFSPYELATWKAQPPHELEAAFYRCWTRKEAYIKATGDGFAMPLTAFDVSLDDPPRLLSIKGDNPERWSLHHLEPAPGYVGTLCIEGNIANLRVFAVRELQGLYDNLS